MQLLLYDRKFQGVANFHGKSEKALKLIFVILKFMAAISQGAWHCMSDDVIDTRTRT